MKRLPAMSTARPFGLLRFPTTVEMMPVVMLTFKLNVGSVGGMGSKSDVCLQIALASII